jgi:hypothetical protein
MKQFVIVLIAVLVGGFLALLAYDRFIVAPRAAEAAEVAEVADRQREQVAPQMREARREARAIADEVEASVQRSLDNAREGMAAQAKDMDRRGLILDAVQRATMFRVALTEYYQANGRWPLDADDAGLPSPEEMRGGAVRSVELGRNGVVTIALDPTFQPDSRIVLEPRANAASGLVDWRCRVSGDPALKQSLPRCEG